MADTSPSHGNRSTAPLGNANSILARPVSIMAGGPVTVTGTKADAVASSALVFLARAAALSCRRRWSSARQK